MTMSFWPARSPLATTAHNGRQRQPGVGGAAAAPDPPPLGLWCAVRHDPPPTALPLLPKEQEKSWFEQFGYCAGG